MSTDNIKGFVSIAGIVSILGIGALAGITYLGMMLSHEQPAVAVGCGIGVFVIGLAALAGAIIGKRARSDFRQNKALMWGSFTAMIAVGAFAFMPSVYTVNYYLNNGSLREKADNDVRSLSAMVDAFRANEQQRLNATVVGLENFLRFNPTSFNPSIRTFIVNDVIGQANSLSQSIIDVYKEHNERMINNSTVNGYSAALAGIRDTVDTWEISEIVALPNRLCILADTITVNLNSMSRRFNFPIIDMGQGLFGYEIKLSQPVAYTATIAGHPSLGSNSDAQTVVTASITFPEAFSEIFTVTWQAALIVAGLFVLYMFNFLLIPASGRGPVRKHKKSDNHGIIL